MAKEKILIVDDESEITKLICAYLTKEHFTPLVAFNGKEALTLLKKEKPDLVILDIMLPDMEGSSLSLEIRKISNAPIIFLSCKTQEIDKIIALSAGGDDYMTKPFMPGELVARIKAHLRRQYSLSNMLIEKPSNYYEFDDFSIDFEAHELSVNGMQIALTMKEFEILKLLVENPRKVFSTRRIFETVWKTNFIENDAKTIMVYISNLRKKIEVNPTNPHYILSVRGVGYKFNQSLFK